MRKPEVFLWNKLTAKELTRKCSYIKKKKKKKNSEDWTGERYWRQEEDGWMKHPKDI